MLRRLVNPILVFPLCLYINYQEALLSETNNFEEIIEEKETQKILNFSEIDNITLKNNLELKALENLVNSSSFNLSLH